MGNAAGARVEKASRRALCSHDRRVWRIIHTLHSRRLTQARVRREIWQHNLRFHSKISIS
jgi:hypothetical protein